MRASSGSTGRAGSRPRPPAGERGPHERQDRRPDGARRRPIRIRLLPSSPRSRPSSKPKPRSGASACAGKAAAVSRSCSRRRAKSGRRLRPERTASVLTAGSGTRAWCVPRSAAAALAAAGYVRVNGTRIDAPGRMVRLGDVITVALDHAVRVLKVRGFHEAPRTA